MKLVVFGLTITSSWGNGHATLLRGLFRALHRRGHRVVFFERDVNYYANHRDLWTFPEARIELYSDWSEATRRAAAALEDADVGMVTSYCPDGVAATELVLGSPARLHVFYDLDTPVTLENLAAGGTPAYIHPGGLGGFDLVLSYTGGAALDELRTRLNARCVAPLYGSVDPEAHQSVQHGSEQRFDLSYLGTYAKDRQDALEELFIAPARQLPERHFVIGGAGYPQAFPWAPNIFFMRHLEPAQHSHFYCSSKLTLNVTRAAMAKMGYCPSGRLFEAAACGVPIISDQWEGLDQFFSPGSEILIARNTSDTMAAMNLPEEELRQIARAARERVLDTATADHRAIDLENVLASVSSQSEATPESMEGMNSLGA